MDRIAMLGTDWRVNATQQWGILLHPLGELNAGEYIFQASDDIKEMRRRSYGVYVQLFINVIVLHIFLHNLICSAKMLYVRYNSVSIWCCAIQTFAGLVFSAFSLSLGLPGGASCRVVMWCVAVCFVCGTLCTNTALLHKAYLAHNRSKKLLVAGIVLMLPQPYIVYCVWDSPITIDGSTGCLIHYSINFPWIKFGLDAPLNLVFSAAFLVVIYRQYKQFGSIAWEKLMSDGMQIMFLIILSNTICMMCALLEVAGIFSVVFFVFDWIITSFLLVQHCNTFRHQANSSLAMKPRTAFALSDISQIVTASSDM
ncbi:hypothetical protein BDF22DRAFT_778775 [Syncephalis plumigaleata]|nr:hypothetical protein BDF22DRAFT_778775 [Syncephalis plumigaleata]